MFGKMKFSGGAQRYPIPPRRRETRGIYIERKRDRERGRYAGNGSRGILKSLRYSPPVDFRPRITGIYRVHARARSYCWVTVDSYARRPPANEAKTGDSRGRSRRVFRKGTPSPPNTGRRRFRKASFLAPPPRKAIYLEKPERTLNGFPFQGYYAFLFNAKLAYRDAGRGSRTRPPE